MTQGGKDDSLVTRQGERVFYTWSAQKDAVPLEIVGAEGARFTTADGARWFDLGSMTWNASLGHGHPRMRKALAEAAARGLLAYPTSVFPARRAPASCWPRWRRRGSTKSFICLSGAEANENAVKIARLVTGRNKIVARTRSYHGATLAMLSLSGDPRRDGSSPACRASCAWPIRTVSAARSAKNRQAAPTSARAIWRRSSCAKVPRRSRR